jgi:glucosamine-6-phosphate deaminase
MIKSESHIEQYFKLEYGSSDTPVNFPFIIVENFPLLGFLTALRFLEWVSYHPKGLISLPTGKTPEFFIIWTAYLLENWDNAKGRKIRSEYGLGDMRKPDLKNLRFVQIDEFYPIPSNQLNSFCNFVKRYYIKGLGLDFTKALFIDSDAIVLPDNRHYSNVFPGLVIDLSLRYREPLNSAEQIQQQSIFAIDSWCSDYESKIRNMGGLGFFLGGIGPDGHIAFNTKGSDHHSTTRLTTTNFETQAVSASDLGGIEISRNRLVITIGLQTITYNPDVTAILFAAGEAKAPVIKNALEKQSSNLYPATALKQLKNARFYLTKGAGSQLESQVSLYYDENGWDQNKTDRAIIDLCVKLGKYAHNLTIEDLLNDPYCRRIPEISLATVNSVLDSIYNKIEKGMINEHDQVYYHTGPHHDDIMLGMLPHIHRLLRNESNRAQIAVLTSGFTAVTNSFIGEILKHTRQFLDEGLIQMTNYPDFFESGYKRKRDKDVYHYLIKVASGEPHELSRGLSHRVVRAIVEIFNVKTIEELGTQINSILETINSSYDGEKNPESIQRLKGMIREFEEELVWAYFGIQTSHVHHMRLGFYTGDLFTEQPNRNRDVEPVLKQLKEIDPTVISLALDPEGSGPDTHYKVLQVLAEAVRIWQKEKDLSNLRIWGYRNVWHRFHAAEANVIVPVSLNAMAVMNNAFTNSYLSQKEASFPSYQYDGKFSDLTKKIWVDQLKTIQLLIGKKYFYESKSARIRTTHGLLFYKEMNVEEFLMIARQIEESMEGLAGRIYDKS